MVIVANDLPGDAQTLPSTSGVQGVPATLPDDPAERAEVLAAVVERQAALLEREDEVHRVLVRIVLGGGSLAQICEAVAGFFGGSAVVTTTDGRVLAMAGPDGEVERARALG